MKLDIVIPAFNEEAAIQAVIRGCLAARADIAGKTRVDRVTITVVSDGSTDRTEELARSFEPEIRVIAYRKNRGYGAALKTGFAANDGELVGFLDGDGTCDPRFFVPLIDNLLEKNASVSIGSRMTSRSKMPLIRKLGNEIWRRLMNWIAQAEITDAASGMRVVRRDALALLEPLPDGLHYTPTMSCRAALDARLSIVEEPMEYEERVGRSKLSVVRDGWLFLRTILDVGLTYQPFRLISVPGIFLLLVALVLLLPVAIVYLQTGMVREDDIYRFLSALVCAVGGFQIFLVGLEAERAVALSRLKKWKGGLLFRIFRVVITQNLLLIYAAIFLALAVLFNAEGLRTYLETRHVYQHWSRTAVGAILTLLAFQCFASALVERVFYLLIAPRGGPEDQE